MKDPARKILTLETAVAWRARLRAAGHTLVVTNGCFDLLHRGHVASLGDAASLADCLLVLVNGDASVRALKGPGRPVNCEADRAYVVAGLRAVAAVVIFAGTDCAAELARLAPDVYAKSDEYRTRQHAGERAALAACGARAVWQAPVPAPSTTELVRRLAKAAAGGAVHDGQVVPPTSPGWGLV
jgi:rfaE bifunctional protein nucleotidyltransferase chain/domain